MTGDSLFGGITVTGLCITGAKSLDYVIVNDKPKYENVKDIRTTTLVTGATTTTLSAYSAGRQATHKTASAYIESLDDNQLAALEVMLENRENDMFDIPELNEDNQNIKKL